MMKLLATLVLFLASASAFGGTTCEPYNGGQSCVFYYSTLAGAMQTDFTHAQISGGATKPLKLRKWKIIRWNGPGDPSWHVMLHESPAGSQQWKAVLWMFNENTLTETFPDPVIFKPGDELCLTDTLGTSASYEVHFTIDP